jgi:hypothetical protein
MAILGSLPLLLNSAAALPAFRVVLGPGISKSAHIRGVGGVPAPVVQRDAIRLEPRLGAVHESGFGTKRTWADVCRPVRFRGEADMRCGLALMARGAIDPNPT